MRKLLLLLTVMLGITLSSASLASAQSTPEGDDIDIEAAAETALSADPEALAEGLETPPDDELLPEGFMNPPDGTPEAGAMADSLAIPVSDLDGAIASTNFTFDADPSVIDGLVAFGALNFIVVEEEITEDQLADFQSGAEEGLGDLPEGTEATVEEIEAGGATAILISVTTEDSGVTAVVDLVALPVGNVLVIGTAVAADQGEVDADAVLTNAEALTLSGVAHVEIVAEEAAG